MSDDCWKKSVGGLLALRCVVVVFLVVPCGLLVGTLLGLISDFGVRNMVENIRLNPEIFANQYARLIVNSGWTALVCLVGVVVIVGMARVLRRGGAGCNPFGADRPAP